MVDECEDLLICDFAETYNVLNYRGLPLRLAATLACGLGANSRVVRHYIGIKEANTNVMLAGITDAINGLTFVAFGDRKKNKRPQSVVEMLTGQTETESTYSTGAEFEKARAALVERINNAG
ncbi:hypothetical protein IJI17_02755 [Candidatus Saccharibacteria bacterium]|nr:hypothetical protein [Achromobacter sp.]MBQ2649476.1 hypothetical protein [Achromobacter sp.]MBQ3839371.1 hypothetical protein [Fibrobacter sp.]MBQ6321110.1 hypothetical protein [Candidatus Saccharibacteria bacterium]